MNREKEIYRVTLWGSVVNISLTAFKFVAGILGCSAAMIADAVHSLSDLLTDVVVLLFVRISSRPADSDHPYGHGKYETLASAIVAIVLLAAGGVLAGQGVSKIVAVVRGGHLDVPGSIALWAALLSVAAKELIYRLTIRVSRKVDSPVLAANAWHHRTDALSSVAAAVGIGGALLFGGTWAILQELLEQSLPADMEQQIREIVAADNELTGLHHLRTRRVGSVCSIEMHLRMPGDTSLYEAHRHSIELERRLRERFGQGTLITIHLEPLKDSR